MWNMKDKLSTLGIIIYAHASIFYQRLWLAIEIIWLNWSVFLTKMAGEEIIKALCSTESTI